MIFYRRSGKAPGNTPMSVSRVRILSLVCLIAYPVGCIISLVGGYMDNAAIDVSGLVLVFVALFAFAGIVGTGVQRITADETDRLDPIEMDLRRQAYAKSYHAVGGIVLLFLLYLSTAGDTQDRLNLWMPSDFDHWNAIIWGAILTLAVMPTTILAWSLPVEEIDDEQAER